MNEEFIYKRRYQESSFQSIITHLLEKSKRFVLRALLKTPLKRKLYAGDSYSIRNEKQQHSFGHDRKIYDKIGFPKIRFFEVFNIDDFEKKRPLLLKYLKDEGPQLFKPKREDLEKKLSSVKDELNTVMHDGDIAYMIFDKAPDQDLIKSASFGFIKTRESYFILSVEITTSAKFRELFSSIVNANDVMIDELVFNDFKKIFKTGIFIKHSAVFPSSIDVSLKNLIADLNYQVKRNITTKLKGTCDTLDSLPRIEYFEVESMQGYSADEILINTIGRRNSGFHLEDKKLRLLVSDGVDLDFRYRIIKEKGHGTQERSPSNLTDYDWLETYELILALSMPCSLSAILTNQIRSLTKLKREIYDYINTSSNRSLFQSFRVFYWKQKYEDIKIKLSLNILTFKRLEDEFNNQNLHNFYFRNHFDLKTFIRKSLSEKESAEDINLEAHLKKTFQYQIERLNREIGVLEQVFKPIEDLHMYRVNIWLQMTSLFIAILALIFAFDKVKEVFSFLFKLFNELMQG